MNKVVALSLALFLIACAAKEEVVQPAPLPEIIEVPVPYYVKVPEELTAFCKWVESDLPSKVFLVSEGRKACLQKYENQFRAIRQIQGTPVPNEKPR